MDIRQEFEAWITAPPFEKDVHIGDENSDWPGAYTDYRVHLAWDAYQAGRRAGELAMRERAAKVCDSVNNHDNPMTACDCADAIRALPVEE